MGRIFLTELANWIRSTGVPVIEYQGWQTRARGSGGYDAMPLCVMWHHTASGSGWDGQRDADYIARGDSDAPLSNLYIDRSGTVWVLAAGATNTNGKGGPLTFSRGTVPVDGMNSRAIGVEMGNNGVGERWSQPQVDSMFAVSNVCNANCGNQPSDISSHNVWAPTRKIDPATCNVAGPWVPRSSNSSGTWNLNDMRDECVYRSNQPGDDFLMGLSQADQEEMRDRILGALPGTYSNEVRGPGGSGNPRTFALDDQDGDYIVSLLEQVVTKLDAIAARLP